MSVLVVLVLAVALLGFVLYWSGRHGDTNRGRGTSLRRGANAHTTSRGRPKKAFATRDAAQASARRLSDRDGASMSVYQCSTCGKWHVGHSG